jgi:hypothetical protein
MIRNRIRIRINLQMTSQTLRNIRALFQGFEPLLEARIWIRIRVTSRIRIRIRSKVISRIRIHSTTCCTGDVLAGLRAVPAARYTVVPRRGRLFD